MKAAFSPRVRLGLGLFCGLILLTAGVFSAPDEEPLPKPTKVSEKVRHQPTPMPDRVVLTWKSDPSKSQAVTWRTDTGVTKAYAEYAVATENAKFAKTATRVDAITTPLKSDLSDAHYHSVEFTELTPATKYAYRVGDGSNWSEWFHFRTASDKPEAFSFIYYGDAQNDIRDFWSRIIRETALDAPKARFIIHAGDLINTANRDGEWGDWFQAGGWLNGTIPSVPTPGNHEYYRLSTKKDDTKADDTKADETKKDDIKKDDTKKEKGLIAGLLEKVIPKGALSKHWRPQFTLPEHGPPGLEETVYYMDYQGMRLISLNSNELQEEQIPWVREVLTNNPNRWTVMTFHHPIFSLAKNRDNAKLREMWRPIIDEFKVDLVLTGHDHTYGRSSLMQGDNALTGTQIRNGESGTVYVVSVSGPKMYTLENTEWTQVSAADTQLYQVIKIDGDTLHYEAHTATGELYDLFELHKSAKGVNTILERAEYESSQATWKGFNRVQSIVASSVGGVLLLSCVVFMVRRRG